MVRYQTYFGVAVPPWKEEKLNAGSTTIRFVLSGRVVSKKNHQQAIAVRRYAKNFLFDTHKRNGSITINEAVKAVNMVYAKMRGNYEYQEFVKKFKPVVQAQMKEWSARLGKKGLTFPLAKATMTLRFYFKDRYITDTVNKQQTIQDLLIESGVIVNDDYRSLNPICSASACYYDELINNISFISLSFRL